MKKSTKSYPQSKKQLEKIFSEFTKKADIVEKAIELECSLKISTRWTVEEMKTKIIENLASKGAEPSTIPTTKKKSKNLKEVSIPAAPAEEHTSTEEQAVVAEANEEQAVVSEQTVAEPVAEEQTVVAEANEIAPVIPAAPVDPPSTEETASTIENQTEGYTNVIARATAPAAPAPIAPKIKEFETKNVFAEGVLVSLRTRMWGATGRLESSMYEINDDTVDKKDVFATMSLLKDVTLIDAMRQVRNKARGYIKANSIYFPDAGFDFVPKKRIAEVAEALEGFRVQFMEISDKLVDTLEALKEEFKEKHPALYDSSKYPSKESLRRSIVFKYVFRVFSTPDEELGVISPQMYQEEMKKWVEDIEAMKEATANIVCKEIASRIEALKEGCETGKISQLTINGFNRLMEKFKNLWSGFVNEKSVNDMMADIELYLEGTSADMLKFDNNFRQLVANKAAKIASQLQNEGYKTSDRGIDL